MGPDPDSAWIAEAQRVARGVRVRVLERVLAHGGGYLSQACSSAEILATLYTRVLRLGPSEAPLEPPRFTGVPGPDNPDPWRGGRYNGPRSPEYDRFVFSPVHYSLALYATLVEVGRLAPEALDHYDEDGSTVEMIGAEHSPGIETTAGSLGQALSHAAGMAWGRRRRGEPGRVWVFMSDGELQEGQTWEAFAAAAHHGLDNLGVYVDRNGQQCDGAMAGVLDVEPLAHRVRAFGGDVREVDGHDVAALAGAAAGAREGPRVVICRTDPCREVALLRGRGAKLHHLRLAGAADRAACARALAALRREGP